MNITLDRGRDFGLDIEVDVEFIADPDLGACDERFESIACFGAAVLLDSARFADVVSKRLPIVLVAS